METKKEMKKILAKIEKQIDKLESAHQKEDDIVEAIKSLLEELQDVKICKESCDCDCH
jgi:DNA-binding protein YbaB